MVRPVSDYAVTLALVLSLVPATRADTIEVAAGESIQAAIDGALSGDLVRVAAGDFNEDLDFGGKAVHVIGAGRHSVLQGTGTGPVVTFATGETPLSILEGFTITGGVATRGGGVLIDNASPTVLRNVIQGNQASVAGSAISIEGDAPARIFNNLVIFNTGEGVGEAHAIQIVNASPVLVNNTVCRCDSNAIHLSGFSQPVILNNALVDNGSGKGATKKGRGICELNGERAFIQHNAFHRNRISALYRGGKEYKRIRAFEKKNKLNPDIVGNIDGDPGYVRKAPESLEQVSCLDFQLCSVMHKKKPGKGVHAGHPDPAANNLDGTRNTLGWTGGPFAPGSTAVPGDTAVGVILP